jgi:hypothetical protein
MSHTYTNTKPGTTPMTSRTRVLFDLRDVLNPAELSKFEESAKQAGAASLTQHFLNLTLRNVAGDKTQQPA